MESRIKKCDRVSFRKDRDAGSDDSKGGTIVSKNTLRTQEESGKRSGCLQWCEIRKPLNVM